MPAPKYVATTRLRMRPTTRLNRMPAAMRKEAARLERGGFEAVAGEAAALSGASFIERRILAGWPLRGRPALSQTAEPGRTCEVRRVRNVIEYLSAGTGGTLCCQPQRASPSIRYAERGASSRA